jgi:methylated-DNA-protein-cysteine methyltransferase related protein
MPPRRDKGAGYHESVYSLVRMIPPGRVATYGQIAAVLGRGTPRMVGYAMAAVPHGSDVPWHRVINSTGRTSLTGEGAEVQLALLEREGVVFGKDGRVNLGLFLWPGPGFGRKRR